MLAWEKLKTKIKVKENYFWCHFIILDATRWISKFSSKLMYEWINVDWINKWLNEEWIKDE